MSETQLVRATIDAVNATGKAYVWRNQSGVIRIGKRAVHLAPEGSPDIIGYLFAGGRMVAIECKVPGGKTKPERARKQEAWRNRIASSGAIAMQVTRAEDAAYAIIGMANGWHPLEPMRSED